MSKILSLLALVAGVDALLRRLREALCDCGTYSTDPVEHAEYCAYRKAIVEEQP